MSLATSNAEVNLKNFDLDYLDFFNGQSQKLKNRSKVIMQFA